MIYIVTVDNSQVPLDEATLQAFEAVVRGEVLNA